MKDKVVLVTGAGQACGRALAEDFAARGAAVVVNDIDADGGRQTVQRIEAGGGTATFVRADVSIDAEVAALVDRCLELHGRLDGAVNNAGVELPVAVADSDPPRSRACWRRTSRASAPASSTRSAPCDGPAAAPS